jgi:uncharacterized protein YqeY
MPTLFETITERIAAAMKQKDAASLAPLRMLKAALMNREVEKGRPLDEAESLQVVASLVKQRRDAVEQFTSGGRMDLADREQSEIELLERYMPPAADDARIETAIDAAIAETGASTVKDMGKVMKATLVGLAGLTVDGRKVSEFVKRRLSSG